MGTKNPKIVGICAQCGGEYHCYPSELALRQYCSKTCHIAGQRARGLKMGAMRVYERPPTFTCLHCGAEKECAKNFVRNRNKGYLTRQKYCSTACANRARNQGGHLDKNGYRLISIGDGKPVFEHRYVMEQKLGRKLLPDETVHHINGDRADNRLENLELWSSRHGKGQRVADKIAFCRQFLADYQDLDREPTWLSPGLMVHVAIA